jgi:hypothetical protein
VHSGVFTAYSVVSVVHAQCLSPEHKSPINLTKSLCWECGSGHENEMVFSYVCRLRCAEEFQRRQEALKLEAELHHEVGARRKLEKRLENLEAGLTQASYSTQSRGVSPLLPPLRAKFMSETAPSGHTALSVNQDIPEGVTDYSTRNSGTASRLHGDDTDNIAEQAEREFSLCDRAADHTCLSERHTPQINNMDFPLNSNDSEYPSNNYSVGKERSEAITISYHRPPTEIIKAAGHGSDVKNFCDSDDNTGALELPESRIRHFEVPTEDIQHVSSLQAEYTDVCKNKLGDSLPIPILRAPSPVIPTLRTRHAASGSDAMHKLEAKWQVCSYLSVLLVLSPVALFCKVK